MNCKSKVAWLMVSTAIVLTFSSFINIHLIKEHKEKIGCRLQSIWSSYQFKTKVT
jgi:hypothetical protein